MGGGGLGVSDLPIANYTLGFIGCKKNGTVAATGEGVLRIKRGVVCKVPGWEPGGLLTNVTLPRFYYLAPATLHSKPDCYSIQLQEV